MSLNALSIFIAVSFFAPVAGAHAKTFLELEPLGVSLLPTSTCPAAVLDKIPVLLERIDSDLRSATRGLQMSAQRSVWSVFASRRYDLMRLIVAPPPGWHGDGQSFDDWMETERLSMAGHRGLPRRDINLSVETTQKLFYMGAHRAVAPIVALRNTLKEIKATTSDDQQKIRQYLLSGRVREREEFQIGVLNRLFPDVKSETVSVPTAILAEWLEWLGDNLTGAEVMAGYAVDVMFQLSGFSLPSLER